MGARFAEKRRKKEGEKGGWKETGKRGKMPFMGKLEQEKMYAEMDRAERRRSLAGWLIGVLGILTGVALILLYCLLPFPYQIKDEATGQSAWQVYRLYQLSSENESFMKFTFFGLSGASVLLGVLVCFARKEKNASAAKVLEAIVILFSLLLFLFLYLNHADPKGAILS